MKVSLPVVTALMAIGASALNIKRGYEHGVSTSVMPASTDDYPTEVEPTDVCETDVLPTLPEPQPVGEQTPGQPYGPGEVPSSMLTSTTTVTGRVTVSLSTVKPEEASMAPPAPEYPVPAPVESESEPIATLMPTPFEQPPAPVYPVPPAGETESEFYPAPPTEDSTSLIPVSSSMAPPEPVYPVPGPSESTSAIPVETSVEYLPTPPTDVYPVPTANETSSVSLEVTGPTTTPETGYETPEVTPATADSNSLMIIGAAALYFAVPAVIFNLL